MQTANDPRFDALLFPAMPLQDTPTAQRSSSPIRNERTYWCVDTPNQCTQPFEVVILHRNGAHTLSTSNVLQE